MGVLRVESIVVEFQDFVDLQTRLILLPRVEEEGIGAVVASYTAATADDSEEAAASPRANAAAEEEALDLEGYVLAGMEESLLSKKDQDDTYDDSWRDKDLSSILAEIRGSSQTPLRLVFAPAVVPESPCDKENERDDEKVDDKKSSDSGTDETDSETEEHSQEEDYHHVVEGSQSIREESIQSKEEEEDRENKPVVLGPSSSSASTPAPEVPVKVALGNRFSSWTTRMRAGAQLAAEAASSAASLSSALTKERCPSDDPCPQQTQELGLFLETTSGAFLSIPSSTARSSELRMTNNSWLWVRRSATQPLSQDQYSFQWYRSSQRSGDGWIKLEGATRLKLQPSATEVGHRLRCVVTKVDHEQDDDNDKQSVDDYDQRLDESESIIICETQTTVSADSMLFNGARQTLVHRDKYGRLMGKGNAEGRTFRIQVELVSHPVTKRAVSAVSIFQVSGDTEAPLQPEPIVGVSAMIPDHADPKVFALTFPLGIPETASMVSALCTEGRFLLAAPKRLARESILLAIGIANYKGMPKELTASQVLYDDGEEDGPVLSEPKEEVSTTDPDSDGATLTSGKASLSAPNTCSSTPLSVSTVLKRSESLDNVVVESESGESELSNAKVNDLVNELKQLQCRLARKDKAFSELQRHVAKSEAASRKTEQLLASREKELDVCKTEKEAIQLSLRRAEKRIETHEDTIKRLKGDHVANVSKLEKTIAAQAERITELEKTTKALENEKAVISAQVGARDSKLSKMEDLQKSFDELTVKIQDQDALRRDMEEANRLYKDVRTELEKASESKQKCQETLERREEEIASITAKLKKESGKTNACKAELETQQIKIQKLIAERNSYKQKGDSLSKEIGRVCRNGRTIRQVEKILADDVARREEVQLLREQKRKALEDLQHYRTAYEQSRIAQAMAGVGHESAKVLERNAELERLLSELTEYVSAKELQVETMRQVNNTLQSELRDLAKANMSKNDI